MHARCSFGEIWPAREFVGTLYWGRWGEGRGGEGEGLAGVGECEDTALRPRELSNCMCIMIMLF